MRVHCRFSLPLGRVYFGVLVWCFQIVMSAKHDTWQHLAQHMVAITAVRLNGN